MKKFFLTMSTVALFAIGFAASDEEESSSNSSNENSKPKTEQKQETDVERQARKKKEEKEREIKEKADKKKQIAEEGYKKGYEKGFGSNYRDYETLDWDRIARMIYTAWHDAPSSPEEKELFDIYLENFKKGVEEGYKAGNY